MGTAQAYAWSQRHPVLVDALLAAALFLTVGLLSAVVASWTGLLFGAALTLPLAVRRRWPAAVFGWTVALSLLQLTVLSRPLPADVVPPFVLYTVAAHVGDRWIRAAAVGAGLLACVLGPWRWYASEGDPRTAAWLGVALAVFLAVLWLLGDLVRARKAPCCGSVRRTRRWLATASSATSWWPSASVSPSLATSTTSWPTRCRSSWSRPTVRPTPLRTPSTGPATRRPPR
ncbi:MAG TPA: hypothetical protein VI110_03550 [Lapillicoccus sp.]